MTIRFIVERFATRQVGHDAWRDATEYLTFDIQHAEIESILKSNMGGRVVGAAHIPDETAPGGDTWPKT